MFGFFLKKAFFDGWDNLFGLAALNVAHIAIFLCAFLLPISLGVSGVIVFVCMGIALFLLSVWQAACARMATDISDYRSISLAAVRQALKQGFVPGMQIGVVNLVLWSALAVGLPFYLSIKSIFGFLAAGLLFWIALVGILVFQYFLALWARFGGGFRKNLRKSALLFLDNPGFSFFLLAHSAIGLVLSVFVAFLMPGLAGLALSQAVGVKLLIKKYDWLEANPGANRRAPPWPALLTEEKELVGPRTLKGMIFPWKEGR